MSALIPAVILCDFVNMQSWGYFDETDRELRGFLRSLRRLEAITTFTKDTLNLAQEKKWLFGLERMRNHEQNLQLLKNAGWKYVPCVYRPGKGGRIIHTSDDVLKETFTRELADCPANTHFVFISDDGDFVPEARTALAQGHRVTYLISGQHKQRKIFNLETFGGRVITTQALLEQPPAIKSQPKPAKTMTRVDKIAHEILRFRAQEAETLLAAVPEDKAPQVARLFQPPAPKVEEKPLPAWTESKKPETPLERFQRRYKK